MVEMLGRVEPELGVGFRVHGEGDVGEKRSPADSEMCPRLSDLYTP